MSLVLQLEQIIVDTYLMKILHSYLNLQVESKFELRKYVTQYGIYDKRNKPRFYVIYFNYDKCLIIFIYLFVKYYDKVILIIIAQ